MQRRTDDGRRSIVAMAGLALALLVTAAGCGDPLADKLESSGRQPYSDDDPALADGTTTTAAPVDMAAMAKWNFVAEVNEICRDRGANLDASTASAASPSGAVRVFRDFVGLYDTLEVLIGQMTPPAGDEAAVAEIVGGFGHLADHFRGPAEAGGFRSEEERIAWTTEAQEAARTHLARLEAYGLSDCG